MDPSDPNVLYAAAYEKQRLPWVFINAGPESGVFKTEDGGVTWSKLAGGLPSGRLGRIGLDIYAKDPRIVYAVVENADMRPPTREEAALDEKRGLPPQEREVGGEVYRTEDGGRTWKKMNPTQDNVSSKGPFYFSQIRVDPNDDLKIFVTGVSLANSTDGGRTWYDLDWPPRRLFAKIFGDVRTLWIDPWNSDRMIMGSDGGIYISYDGGATCDHYYNLPVSQFYAVGVDMENPYNIYGGLQDHEHWKGPSNSADRQGITLLDWTALGSGDGMYTQADPEDGRWLYTSMQYGGFFRVDQKQGWQRSITPQREAGRPPYRFLWCPPLHISPHNSAVLYAGAQVLLRSLDHGGHWQEVSPDLTGGDEARLVPRARGGQPWFAVSTIGESPVAPGVIWVGTCDGRVWMTRDGGSTWSDLTKRLAAVGAPETLYVSRVFPSHFKAGTAYVTKTGFWQDDFRPFVLKTEDFGATWKSLSAGLPGSPVNVIFEDRKNPELLFLGTDMGAYVSIDGGQCWVRFSRLPVVPVKDLLVHLRENDLVLATFGRGLYVADISPLQEMNAAMLEEDVHLFDIEPAVQRVVRSFGANDYLFGDRHLITPNEPNAVAVSYYLRSRLEGGVSVVVTDVFGREAARLQGKAEAGVNTILWDMRLRPADRESAAPVRRPQDVLEQWVLPGDYLVTLGVGGRRISKKARIKGTTGWKVGPSVAPVR